MPVPITERPDEPAPPETVILVHGLWMTGMELRWLGRRLKRCGFAVRYFRYPSWRGCFTDAALRLSEAVARADGERVHLAGHSLGGMVIAKMLELAPTHKIHRIALLGSPIRGNAVAGSLARYGVGRFILGPVAREGIIEKRPSWPAGRELLVVAGTLPLGFGVFFGLSFPHDGTVAMAETEVPGAQTLLVRASHMGMLISSRLAAGLCAFFRTGRI
ncbi:MAG: hypothetical protein FD174_1841 [Geobacteraceae bacterium]|nr:MAG: hypothetical protein FD174_1841 [Geobacteraceae bacterium]